jgi:hypothetical protein
MISEHSLPSINLRSFFFRSMSGVCRRSVLFSQSRSKAKNTARPRRYKGSLNLIAFKVFPLVVDDAPQFFDDDPVALLRDGEAFANLLGVYCERFFAVQLVNELRAVEPIEGIAVRGPKILSWQGHGRADDLKREGCGR